MFLLNSCLSLFSAACLRRHPFSRSYGVILPSSLTMLLPSALVSSTYLPVSVYGTGAVRTIAAFLDTLSSLSPTLFRSSHRIAFRARFFLGAGLPAFPALSIRGRALRMCPHSSVASQYRNLHLSSIGYGSRPHLRSRLTQGRSALPWKPWIFGLEDSHLHLATHSGILSSHNSTRPSDRASSLWQCSPTNV